MSSTSSFSESFCLAELLQSKSIDVSQVSFVTDNARLPSESLLESISSSCTTTTMSTTSSTSSQRQLQDEVEEEEAPHQDEEEEHKGENTRRSKSRKSVVGKTKNTKPRHPYHHQGIVTTKAAPFYMPNIPFGSIMLDGSSSNGSSSSSNGSDLDVEGVMEILDESLNILENTTRLLPTFSSYQ